MKRRQGGVALVLAMLVMTLSVVLVMPVFVRQEYLTRYAAMQQEQAASRAVLRSAIAYVAEVLDDDARRSNVDHLGERWRMDDVALPVASLAGPVSPMEGLTVSVADAGSRFNLANLSQNGVVDEVEVAALAKLLALLRADPAAAASIARVLAATQVPSRMPGAPPARAASSAVPVTELADMLALAGLAAGLGEHLVLLPEATPVNLNTADAPLLAARFPAMSLAQALQVVQLRSQAYFRDPGDFMARAQGMGIGETLVNVSVSSDYFVVRLKVLAYGAVHAREALMCRGGGRAVLLGVHDAA